MCRFGASKLGLTRFQSYMRFSDDKGITSIP
jgi:hypothetical protein